MKKIAVILFFAGMTSGMFAQIQTFTDVPFGLGIGFSPAWLMPDFSSFNDKIKDFGTDKLPVSGFYAPGYSGFVHIGFLRIGGVRLNGSTCQEKNINGFNHKVEYSSGFSGLSIEYTLPWFRKFVISTGLIIGHGSSSLVVSRHAVKTYSWNGEWGNLSLPGSTTDSYTRTFSHDYFTLAPTVIADFPANRFVSFRLGAGYSIPFGNTWTMDNDIDVANMPSSSASGGLYFTAGIFFGFFAL